MEDITRLENFLSAIANGTDVPEPITRLEKYLKAIADNGGGGGGGGADDFLVEFSLVMSGDDWTVTTETSVDDIIAAKTAGKNVKCKAVNRLDIDEGQYMLNEMFGNDYTYAEMVIEGMTAKMLHFALYWFNSEKWVQCDLIGGYSIEEGQTSEDFWMFQPQETD